MSGEIRDNAFDLDALAGIALNDLPFNAFFPAVAAPAERPPRGFFGFILRRLVGRAELVAPAAQWFSRGTVRTPPASLRRRRVPARPAPAPVPAPQPALMPAWFQWDEHAALVREYDAMVADVVRRRADEQFASDRQDVLREARCVVGRLEGLSTDADAGAVLERIRADLGQLVASLAQAQQNHENTTRAADALAARPYPRLLDVLEGIRQGIATHGLTSFRIRFVSASRSVEATSADDTRNGGGPR